MHWDYTIAELRAATKRHARLLEQLQYVNRHELMHYRRQLGLDEAVDQEGNSMNVIRINVTLSRDGGLSDIQILNIEAQVDPGVLSDELGESLEENIYGILTNVGLSRSKSVTEIWCYEEN